MKKNKTILQRQIIESVRFMSSSLLCLTDDLSKGSTKTNAKIASLFLSM